MAGERAAGFRDDQDVAGGFLEAPPDRVAVTLAWLEYEADAGVALTSLSVPSAELLLTTISSTWPAAKKSSMAARIDSRSL